MSRLPPFIRKNAATTVATATVATIATDMPVSRLPPLTHKNAATTVATAIVATLATDTPVCSNNSDCSSSNPLGEAPNTAPTVASVAGVAVANAADQFSERWQYMFHERAAICEYDGGMSRADAEAAALGEVVAQWRCENPPPPSDEKACAHCGKPGPCTPVLAAGKGHAWLHRDCWGPMNEALRAKAEAAVRVLLGVAQ